MQVKTIRAIARAYNAGFKDGKAAVQAERNEQRATDKPSWQVLHEELEAKLQNGKTFFERALAIEGERDHALARIATLEQQLTDAASKINELEAGSVAPAVAPTRKKYEAPEYQPLPEGCEIGEGYRQLAVGETVQECDEFWSISTERWVPTEYFGRKIKIDQNNIYRRKQ